jgi:hypothetical protein
MSLARLALRLAAVESLAPVANASAGPWPTAAGPLIYDSRIDPIAAAKSEQDYEAALAALDNKPIVTIYTEDDHALPYGAQKAFADEQTCTLVAEIMIAAIGAIQYQGPDGTTKELGALEPGATDREREALLDLIDSQIRRVFDLRNQMAPLMTMVAMEMHSIHDDPHRDIHRTARLALRTVKFHIKVKKEVWPPIGTALGSGLEALPTPLREVGRALPDGSSGKAVVTFIAGSLQAPPDLPALLAGIKIFATLDRPVLAPDAATVAAGTDVPADVTAAIGSVT